MDKFTRRRFLSHFAAKSFILYSAVQLANCRTEKRSGSAPRISKILRVTRNDSTDRSGGFDNVNLNEKIIKEMIDQGIKAYTGRDSGKDAWRCIIPDPSKKVAIKINCQITGIYTKSKLVNAVIEGLIESGVSPENIIIYDLRDTAFKLAGFKKNSGSGVKVGTNDSFGGYSYINWFGNLIKGPRERFCKVLSGEGQYGCDYLINMPVLKALDNHAGVTISMKNHFGSVENPADLHETIHQSIAKLNAHPLIAEKTRLIILDGIFAQYKWTNGRNQKFVVLNNQIFFGNDPVAMDTVGWEKINKIRKEKGLERVKPEPKYIKIAAEKYKIGNCNKDKIQIVDI